MFFFFNFYFAALFIWGICVVSFHSRGTRNFSRVRCVWIQQTRYVREQSVRDKQAHYIRICFSCSIQKCIVFSSIQITHVFNYFNMPSWCSNSTLTNELMGTAVAQWLRCCATNRKVAGSIPASVIWFFIDIKFFRSHYDPGVDSASNRNEYQEYFVGGKGGRCVRLTTLPPSCAVVMKSGNLNFLEPSGHLQACNGTALTLPLH